MEAFSTADLESELDDLIVRILELMNQHIVCKMQIENYMKSGYIDLAKARYINGNRSISALQLPTEDAIGVVAKFKILPVDTEEKGDFLKYVKFEHSDTDQQNILTGLKSVDLNADNSTKRFSCDPLKWFGFLVPQSLRQSKATFEHCLKIVVESVNVQLELQHSIDKYNQLRKLVQ